MQITTRRLSWGFGRSMLEPFARLNVLEAEAVAMLCDLPMDWIVAPDIVIYKLVYRVTYRGRSWRTALAGQVVPTHWCMPC